MKRCIWPLVAALGLAACASPAVPLASPPSTGLDAEHVEDDASRRAYGLLATSQLSVVGVTVDSQLSSSPKERLIDRNLTTAWVNGGYNNPTSWARVELAGSSTLTSISLKTGTSKPGTSYDVQVSSDGITWKTVLANQTNATWGMETKTLPQGTSGKFVRVFWRNNPSAPTPHFVIYERAVVGFPANRESFCHPHQAHDRARHRRGKWQFRTSDKTGFHPDGSKPDGFHSRL